DREGARAARLRAGQAGRRGPAGASRGTRPLIRFAAEIGSVGWPPRRAWMRRRVCGYRACLVACSASFVALLAAGPNAASAAASRPAPTFGQTSVGASLDVFSANRKRVSEYSLTVAGSVSKLTVYLAPTTTP